MPKGIQVRQHGGPEVLTYADVEVREPGAGELLVDVSAAGVNFIDTYYRTGAYPAELPFTAKVREATGGEGVAAVYDGVGKTTFDGSLA